MTEEKSRGPAHNVVILAAHVHENFSVLMTYAFSQNRLCQLVEDRFCGEWKFLNKACFETSQLRANRALLELAAQLRTSSCGAKPRTPS